MRIQHNIAALNSHRQLGNNNNAVAKNLERLSSGYRINRAGDDAAGLAISEKMRAQITGLKTAQKNANDGISLVQTAEGALTEVHSMLNRMVELANQSANGTYDNNVDRANLQKEMDSLKSEIDRISDGTNFNGINLLDGSLGGTTGAGGLTGGVIASYKGATTANAIAGIDASNSGAIDFFKTDTINVDGTEVKVDWSGLSDIEKAALGKNWTSTSGVSEADAAKAASILQDTINKSIDNHNKTNGTNLQHIKVGSTGTATAVKSFTFTSGQKDGNSKVSFSTAGITAGTDTHASVLTGLLGTTTANTVATAAPALSPNFTLGDLANGKFTLKLDDQTVEVSLGATAPTDMAGLVTLLNQELGTALGHYDDANGLTGSPDAMAGKLQVKINAQGALEFSNNTGKQISFEDKDGGDTAKLLGISTEGKSLSSGGLTLQIGDTADKFNQLTVSIGAMNTNALGLSGINISTQTSAQGAVASIKKAINQVSSTRGDLGAIQNRLEHTINNLSVTTENMTAAESRIRDVDMAEEMMNFTKNNILTQASQAMLAQANQLPQGVLQLLR